MVLLLDILTDMLQIGDNREYSSYGYVRDSSTPRNEAMMMNCREMGKRITYSTLDQAFSERKKKNYNLLTQ